jgi:predicted enzyme related to lactoylglutathione lyase
MKPNPIVWFEIYVKDMERAKRFYESVFETKLEKLNSPLPGLEMWQFPSAMNASGATGALVKMKDMELSGNGTAVYFECDDCAVEERRVKKFGGRVQREKTSIGEHGKISLVYDTEDNLLGLHSM